MESIALLFMLLASAVAGGLMVSWVLTEWRELQDEKCRAAAERRLERRRRDGRRLDSPARWR